MQNLPSINAQLWLHMNRGGGIAAIFRTKSKEFSQDYLEALNTFFNSRDDYSRIIAAYNVVDFLLRINNLQYLIYLRDLVTEIEENRHIVYVDQTDHTIHTLYLFLLGVWIFDHSQKYRDIFANFHSIIGLKHITISFIFQWFYAGLFHDVGYVFENFTKPMTEVRNKIDKLFDLDNLESWNIHFKYCSEDIKVLAMESISAKFHEWKENRQIPDYSSAASPNEVIMELDKCPWYDELFHTNINKKLPCQLSQYLTITDKQGKYTISGEILRDYALDVSINGYSDKGDGLVDHGYASGCLLLQLTSLRYWIINNVPTEISHKFSRTSNYNLENIKKDIIPACQAASAHNFKPIDNKFKDIFPFRIASNPILFLSVLCDELQKWHRGPMHTEYVSAPFSDEKKRKLIPISEDIFYLGETTEFGRGPSYDVFFGYDDKNESIKIVESIYKKLSQFDLSIFFGFAGEAKIKSDSLRLKKADLELSSKEEPD